MIELMTTEAIPSWSLCYFWNGETEGLEDEEIEAMQKWENEMIERAKKRHPRKQFAGLAYEFADGDDAESYFTNYPAFGTRNKWALTRRGESPFLACDVYDVNIYANYN